MTGKPSAFAVLLIALLGISACTLALPPGRLDVPEPPPDLQGAGSLALENGQDPASETRFPAGPGAGVFVVNYHEYTEAALEALRAVLEEIGFRITPGAEKHIELSVVHIAIVRKPMGGNRCFVDVTVRTADGYIRGHQTVGESLRFCHSALTEVAPAVLEDPGIRAYLSRR